VERLAFWDSALFVQAQASGSRFASPRDGPKLAVASLCSYMFSATGRGQPVSRGMAVSPRRPIVHQFFIVDGSPLSPLNFFSTHTPKSDGPSRFDVDGFSFPPLVTPPRSFVVFFLFFIQILRRLRLVLGSCWSMFLPSSVPPGRVKRPDAREGDVRWTNGGTVWF